MRKSRKQEAIERALKAFGLGAFTDDELDMALRGWVYPAVNSENEGAVRVDSCECSISGPKCGKCLMMESAEALDREIMDNCGHGDFHYGCASCDRLKLKIEAKKIMDNFIFEYYKLSKIEEELTASNTGQESVPPLLVNSFDACTDCLVRPAHWWESGTGNMRCNKCKEAYDLQMQNSATKT